MNLGVTKLWMVIFVVMLFGVLAFGQEPTAASDNGGKDKTVTAPAVTPARVPESSSEQHRFWDRKNAWLFAGVAASRALDYQSTRNMQSRGREEMLLPDDVANNSAGFAALEAAGAATSIGLSYVLHRTGHHRLERWLSIGHISVTTFGAVRNYSLESKHP